jgi:predicted nucleic acid-binding Zn ribbon protein
MNELLGCTCCKESGEVHGFRFVGQEGMEIREDYEYTCPACGGEKKIDLKKLTDITLKRPLIQFSNGGFYIAEATYDGSAACFELLEVLNDNFNLVVR